MHFLVIGIGSIGERHIKNLKSLGIDISVYDKYADVFQPNSGLPELTPQLNKLERIIQEYGVNYADPHNYHEPFDAFIICTPPAYHTEYIVQGMQHHSHIFVEKPISDKLEYLDWVIQTSKNKELIVQVGYQFRFHTGLKFVKKLLDEGKIGKLLSIRAEFGQYLPDWHPDEDYRNSYVGKEKDGGGIILDASHEIDYVRWLAGSEVKSISCFAGKLSSLDIDVEDTANINLNFENGTIGNIHVDMVNKRYTRWCKLIGEKGTITWDYTQHYKKEHDKEPIGTIELHLPNNKLDIIYYVWKDMYLEELKHFITCIETKQNPISDGSNARKVLSIALAAKESARENKIVEI